MQLDIRAAFSLCLVLGERRIHWRVTIQSGSFCRGQIIYFNPAQRRAEDV